MAIMATGKIVSGQIGGIGGMPPSEQMIAAFYVALVAHAMANW